MRFVFDHADGLPESVEGEVVAHGVKRPGPHALATIEARCAHLSKAHPVASLPSPVTASASCSPVCDAGGPRQGGQKRALALIRLVRLAVAALAEAGIGSMEKGLTY